VSMAKAISASNSAQKPSQKSCRRLKNGGHEFASPSSSKLLDLLGMRTARLLALILIATSFIPLLQAEEIIKDKSPDRKFALRMTHGEEGWDTEIIETATKKKVIDLESVAVDGEKDRIVSMSDSSEPIERYGNDATLIWSRNSQRVAYYNFDRANRTMSIYFRNGSKFEEVSLPEFPKCDAIKDEDPKYLKTVWFKVRPSYWMDSGALSVDVDGWWRTLKGESLKCEQVFTIAFDAQAKATIAKAEEPPEEIGRKIESPNGTFFIEELPAPTKNEAGETIDDQEVWIVSAKDPTARERLPDFHENSGIDAMSDVAISPDENWMLVSQHHASSWNSTYLLHRKEGWKFEHLFKSGEAKARFDNEAWKFFSKIEGVPFGKIDANEEGPRQVSFLEWSEDSGRLLIDLHGGLTGKDDLRSDDKKPGVSLWLAYYNTRTRKFELTDKLRKWNKGARKRWMASDTETAGVLPPAAELIGHEGPDASVAERLKKYETELAVMVKRHEGELDGADRAEFEKKEAEWRDKLDDDAAQIKDPAKRLGMRARSTWYHLIDVREERLPVYEQPKSEETSRPQP
jgi:hypothetical protein